VGRLTHETSTSNHWVLFKLIGTRSNRSAVGSLVQVTAGGRMQIDQVRAGSGYQSADDLRLHFGLGTNSVIDRVQIAWPSGLAETWTNLPSDRILRLSEGQGTLVQ
jgi:hypothetical protein